MTTFVGRRAHSPYERGVCVRLPSPLIEAVDRYADFEFTRRSEAIRTLLEEGLKAVGRPMRERDRERR
jgi:metal-responsive CopG/Arc/MetJ family transcriptional regulator